ncbi:MAG TPA: ABC transporter permease [Candidatus Limnocylindria bacterium]|nr:ABC transporter permease [Candidatus Limnocylindria bacterium]
MAVGGDGAAAVARSIEARGPIHGARWEDAWRTFRTAVGLGWAVESNWSDPFLFAVYTVAKPLSAALILVLMFNVITGGGRTAYLEFLVVGSGLWQVVFGVLTGLVNGILEDRERYRMLRYVVLTPASVFPFLLGRGVARLLISLLAVGVTLAVGVVLLGVELRPEPVLLAAASLGGLVAVVALGIVMAGWCLQLRQEGWFYPEAVAGALYLVSGAIFPLDVLPGYLQPLGWALPTTWWLEASRRGLLGEGAPGSMATLPDGVVLALMTATTLVTLGVALTAWSWFLRRARRQGLLDMVTGG